jgi:hypothetical protein
VDPARSAGRNRRGVLSFGYLFFAQAKKSNSLAIASETRRSTKCLQPAFICRNFKQAKTGSSTACELFSSITTAEIFKVLRPKLSTYEFMHTVGMNPIPLIEIQLFYVCICSRNRI